MTSGFETSYPSELTRPLLLQRGGNHSKTLVIFSGPRSFADESKDKSMLYWKNFYYFLEHGITCNEDVVVVVGEVVYSFVEQKVLKLKSLCRDYGSKILLISRADRCYDMESIRLGLAAVRLEDYQYFVIQNDGVTGPKVDSTDTTQSWTHVFTDLFSDRVKMAGLSINCHGHINPLDPHINSFLYAFDYVGVQLAISGGAIYDCLKGEGGDDRWSIMTRYEIGMSKAILEAGYMITSLAQNLYLDSNNITSCQTTDMWYRHEMYRWWGHIPTLEKLHFFKSTRFVPETIATELGYTGTRVFKEELDHWNAENTEVAMGGRSIMRYTFDPKVHVVILVETCSNSIAWATSYFSNVNVRDYTIVSMCGETVIGAPQGAKLLSIASVEHNYVFASLIRELADNVKEQEERKDDIIFFIDASRSRKSPWSAEEMFNAADVKGFACMKRPYCSPRCSMSLQPTVLHLSDEWSSFSIPSSAMLPEPTAPSLGLWYQLLGTKIPDGVLPVCYGGNFAFKRNQLSKHSVDVWRNLERVLQNHQDAFYVERAWAALLSDPLPVDVRSALIDRTERVLGPDSQVEREKKFSVQQWKLEMKGMLLWRQ